MSDDEINEELEVIDSLESDESIKVDQHNDIKLWEDKTAFEVREQGVSTLAEGGDLEWKN